MFIYSLSRVFNREELEIHCYGCDRLIGRFLYLALEHSVFLLFVEFEIAP